MTTQALDAPVTATTDGDCDCHYVCCDEDVALCGEDVTGEEWCADDHLPACVTCRVLNECGMGCAVCSGVLPNGKE